MRGQAARQQNGSLHGKRWQIGSVGLEVMVTSGEFKATSPDLTLNGGLYRE